jgi:hypothetical protein
LRAPLPFIKAIPLCYPLLSCGLGYAAAGAGAALRAKMTQMFGRLKEFWKAPKENRQLGKELEKANERIARQRLRIRENRRLRKELEKANKALEKANERIARQRLRIKQLQDGSEGAYGIRAENIIWIFGGARTGSTWLSEMMGELEGCAVWNEPLVGALFGNLYYERAGHRIGKPGRNHILGDRYRESWLGSIRAFVLKEASARFPEAAGPSNYLVVKEPNGSFGAPLLMEALPESRMILLVRDPRDVVASAKDARSEGGWGYEEREPDIERSWRIVEENPDAFVRLRARFYRQRIEITKQAYEAHKGGKVVVKYEDLVADALGTMRHIYSELGIRVDEEELEGAVERHKWENIPEQEKGLGTKRRKGVPGGWREDLAPEHVRIVEEETRPLLEELYP